jgi:predicted esterase
MLKTTHPRSLVYIPDGPGPHPILCFLHGKGEAATQDSEGTEQEPLHKLLRHRSPAWHAEQGSSFVRHFLVICPQLEIVRRWERSDSAWIDELVERAIREHEGDGARLALTGFSYGGEGTFQVAAASGLHWSSIWAVDPALQRVPPLPKPGVRVWVHYGDAQPGAHNMPSFAEALSLEFWKGDFAARRIVTPFADRGHGETCSAAYAQRQVYDWLLG